MYDWFIWWNTSNPNPGGGGGGLSVIFYSMKKYVANCYSKTFEENHRYFVLNKNEKLQSFLLGKISL